MPVGKTLYDSTTHCLKIIRVFFIKKIGKNIIFYAKLCINPNKIKDFPTYCYDTFIKWGNIFSYLSSSPLIVASQCLWLNNYIKIVGETIFGSSLSAKGTNFVGQHFQNNQHI